MLWSFQYVLADLPKGSESIIHQLISWTKSMNKTFHLSFSIYISCQSCHLFLTLFLTRPLCWVSSVCLSRSTIQISLLCCVTCRSPTSANCLSVLFCFQMNLTARSTGMRVKGERRVKSGYFLLLFLSHRPRFGCDCFLFLKITATVNQLPLYRSLQVLLTTDCWVDGGDIWEENFNISCDRYRLLMVW